MSEMSLDSLRSTPDDRNFHTSRVMFWILNGQVIAGPTGSPLSHLEMAESMGWLTGSNHEQFFNENPRGFYLEDGNRVHFYHGVGFGFDDELKKQVLNSLPQVRQTLNLEDTTQVYLGPKDTTIKGIDYPIEYLGTIGNLIIKK